MRYGWREADGSHNEGRRRLLKAKKRAFGDDEESYGDDEDSLRRHCGEIEEDSL